VLSAFTQNSLFVKQNVSGKSRYGNLILAKGKEEEEGGEWAGFLFL